MTSKPDWLDRDRYPFESNFFYVDGHRLHYVDEGSGSPVVFLHGNPTWSFMYRRPIRRLSEDYRCVAPDFVGFGLSDKPEDWGYRPWDHADALVDLLDSMGLNDVHLVAHDWGGPIGLSTVLDGRIRARSITLLNTWLWSLFFRPTIQAFSRFLGSTVGRYLIKDWELFTRHLMKAGCARTDSLPEDVHRHYRAPFDEGSMQGVWQFPADLIQASDWLKKQWGDRENIAGASAMLAWGMRDPAFTTSDLDRWEELFESPRVERLEEASHYVMEDAGPRVSDLLEEFLDRNE